MRFAVIGLGSMGKRRIRLLKQIQPEAGIIGVDTRADRREAVSNELQIKCYSSLDEALREADAVLVCTAPLSHGAIVKECLQAGKHVFTELNLVSDGYEENIMLAKQKHICLFQSSSLLYRKEIAYICNSCQVMDQLSYSYHVGQYLPDWHPWETIQDFFVNEIRTNGCRELFAIELPWLLSAFGKVVHFHVVKRKQSSLPVRYPDTYHVLLEHERGNVGSLWVDVVSRKPGRTLEVSSEQFHLRWDGTPAGLWEYQIDAKQEKQLLLYDDVQKDPRYSANIIENMYVDELLAFIREMKQPGTAVYTMEEDQKTLALIDQLEDHLHEDLI